MKAYVHEGNLFDTNSWCKNQEDFLKGQVGDDNDIDDDDDSCIEIVCDGESNIFRLLSQEEFNSVEMANGPHSFYYYLTLAS